MRLRNHTHVNVIVSTVVAITVTYCLIRLTNYNASWDDHGLMLGRLYYGHWLATSLVVERMMFR